MKVVDVFVEEDSAGCMSGGGGEHEHEVRDGSCPSLRVQNSMAAGV